jgi:uncharacterized membrane protein
MDRRKVMSSVIRAALAVSLCTGSSMAAERYHLVEVSALPGDMGSDGIALNDRGQVIALGYDSCGNPTQCYLWNLEGSTQVIDIPGVKSLSPVAINDLGQVVGIGYFGYEPRAFLWEGPRTYRFLSAPSGSDHSYAFGVSAAGEIVGSFDFGNTSTPCTWPGNGNAEPISGGTPWTAHLVNDSGALAGEYTDAEGYQHPARWASRSNPPQCLRLPGAMLSFTRGINKNGDIVCNEYLSAGGSGQVIWWANGTWDRLEFPSGWNDGLAAGIDDAGEVIGYGNEDHNDVLWIWSKLAGLRILNDLLPNSAHGWWFNPIAVSHNGMILADAQYLGADRLVLIVPDADSP